MSTFFSAAILVPFLHSMCICKQTLPLIPLIQYIYIEVVLLVGNHPCRRTKYARSKRRRLKAYEQLTRFLREANLGAVLWNVVIWTLVPSFSHLPSLISKSCYPACLSALLLSPSLTHLSIGFTEHFGNLELLVRRVCLEAWRSISWQRSKCRNYPIP